MAASVTSTPSSIAPIYWADPSGRSFREQRDWPWLASNALFYLATYPLMLTMRLRWRRPPTDLAAAAASGQRLLYYGWHHSNWMAYFAMTGLDPQLRPLALAHDGAASRWNHRVGAWFGTPTLVFRRRAPARPRAQIIEFLRARPHHLLLFPDSGGPYGVIKPGIVEIARALDMHAIPIVLRSDPELRLGARMRHQLPSPFATIELAHGPAIAPAQIDVERLHAALERLEIETETGDEVAS